MAYKDSINSFCLKTNKFYTVQQIKSLTDWSVTNLGFIAPALIRSEVQDVLIEYISTLQLNISAAHSSDNSETTTYFSASKEYLGNRIISYGGYLTYTIVHIVGPEGSLFFIFIYFFINIQHFSNSNSEIKL